MEKVVINGIDCVRIKVSKRKSFFAAICSATFEPYRSNIKTAEREQIVDDLESDLEMTIQPKLPFEAAEKCSPGIHSFDDFGRICELLRINIILVNSTNYERYRTPNEPENYPPPSIHQNPFIVMIVHGGFVTEIVGIADSESVVWTSFKSSCRLIRSFINI